LRRHGAALRIAADLEELFARMVFNILATNDDDHLLNHGLQGEPEARGWALVPYTTWCLDPPMLSSASCILASALRDDWPPSPTPSAGPPVSD